MQEEITKRKSAASNLSANFKEKEQNNAENEIYNDPLEKYRAVKKIFQKNIEQPKEIWQNPNKRRNILILVVLILFGLVLCNLFFTNQKKIVNDQEKLSNSTINQESKLEKQQTNFDQIQVMTTIFNLYFYLKEDGYKKIALPIYQRLKVEVQVFIIFKYLKNFNNYRFISQFHLIKLSLILLKDMARLSWKKYGHWYFS